MENQKELFGKFSTISNELTDSFEIGKNLGASQNIPDKLNELNNKRDGILNKLEENSEMVCYTLKKFKIIEIENSNEIESLNS